MMLETTHNLIRRVGDHLGLGSKQIDQLLTINALHSFDIKLKNGKTFKAFRAQHSNKHGPYKGGIRFHPNVNEGEVTALATLMSLKTAALGLPLGGGKGGIAVDPRHLTDAEVEEISRIYVRQLHHHIGPDKDIPAPDVNTDPKVIDWMVDEYELITGDTSKASFTGKSEENKGSLGRKAATGRGGVIALTELLKQSGVTNKDLTLAIQGFGNVGSHFAKTAASLHPNWQLVAASDSGATVINEKGLDIDELVEFKNNRGRFSEGSFVGSNTATPDEIISIDCDVLILAALDNAINETNLHQVKAKYIVELANGPISDEASQTLLVKRKIILPDIIANAGGVVVSYLEWLQNKNDERWSEKDVNDKLNIFICEAVENVYKISQKDKVSLKEAAFALALERLAK